MGKVINSGFKQLNIDKSQTNKTVLVFGVSRSGTSMLGEILVNLGVNMGTKAAPPLFEDYEIYSALESDKAPIKKFKEIVARKNKNNSTWGWKRPSTLNHFNKIAPYIRNPHIIIPFRDYISISMRAEISGGREFKKHFKEVHNFRYQKIVDFITDNDYPMLLASYEKSILNPSALVDTIIDFLDLTVRSEVRENAISKVEANNPRYHQAKSHNHNAT